MKNGVVNNLKCSALNDYLLTYLPLMAIIASIKAKHSRVIIKKKKQQSSCQTFTCLWTRKGCVAAGTDPGPHIHTYIFYTPPPIEFTPSGHCMNMISIQT